MGGGPWSNKWVNAFPTNVGTLLPSSHNTALAAVTREERQGMHKRFTWEGEALPLNKNACSRLSQGFTPQFVSLLQADGGWQQHWGMEQMETLVAKLSSPNENELAWPDLLALSPDDATAITVPTKNSNIMSVLFSEMPRVQRTLREGGTGAENMPTLRSIMATMTDDEACVTLAAHLLKYLHHHAGTFRCRRA